MFWGTMQGTEDYMQTARNLADTDQLVELGIKILGPATLLTLLVLRWGRWNAQRKASEARRAAAPDPSPVPQGAPA